MDISANPIIIIFTDKLNFNFSVFSSIIDARIPVMNTTIIAHANSHPNDNGNPIIAGAKYQMMNINHGTSKLVNNLENTNELLFSIFFLLIKKSIPIKNK